MNGLDKNLVTILGIGLAGVLVWVGFSIYFAQSSVSVNPNAQTYVTPIPKSFDLESFAKVDKRIKENFPISSDVLRAIESLAVVGNGK